VARAGARHPGLPPPVSLQRRYAPTSRCFGCGPANEQGLRIESHEAGGVPGELRATWQPRPHHAAFENVLNGGVIGTLLDCHANWTATWHLMRARAADRPPTTVTLEYAIRIRRFPDLPHKPMLESLRAYWSSPGADAARPR